MGGAVSVCGNWSNRDDLDPWIAEIRGLFRFVPFLFFGLALLAGLIVDQVGPSVLLLRFVGASAFLIAFVPFLLLLLRFPNGFVHPISILFLGSSYHFIFDMAVLRQVGGFSPASTLDAYLLIIFFMAITTGVWLLFPLRTSLLEKVVRTARGSLSANAYFWLAVLVFSAELARRLFFVDWNLKRFVDEMLMARAGGSFRRGVEGDWRVVFTPVEVMFLGMGVYVKCAWRHGFSISRRAFLVLLWLLQLIALVLDGTRGNVLISILIPLFMMAAEHNRRTGRWLAGLLLASFAIAPVMDLMVGVRGYGWQGLDGTQEVSWHIASAHRDNNLYYAVVLVDSVRDSPGILAFKGPLGFLDGLKEVGGLWLITPIPRVLWPAKPIATDMWDETRPWYAADSIVGGLFRSGGITFVFLGAVLFGLWLALLEKAFFLENKDDGQAFVYAGFAAATMSMLRAVAPWNTLPLLMIVGGVVIVLVTSKRFKDPSFRCGECGNVR